MSRRSHQPKPIGTVLQDLIAKLGIGRKLDEARAIEAWAELAGPAIIAVTDSVWLRSGTLFVKVTSPTWRHELHLQRVEWRDRINEYVGTDVVREIVFR